MAEKKETHTIEKVEKTTDKERWIRISTTEREVIVMSKFKEDKLSTIEATAKRVFEEAREKREGKDVQ